MSKEELEELLAWVNEVRADIGCPPISRLKGGKRGSFISCPLAESIGADVGVSREGVYYMIHTRDMYKIARLPLVARKFLLEFDGGRMKELERT